MALTCPRCATEVTQEAMYCPYCSLPKPKRGFAPEIEDHQKEVNSADQRNPQIAFKNSSKGRKTGKERKKRSKRSTELSGKPPRRLRVSTLSISALVALLCVGIYVFVVPMLHAEEAEPKTVLSALEKLRKSPSNEEGLTIDARLTRELETARRAKNLTAYQGWIVRPIKGSKTKVVLAFSFQEVGDVNQSAEWLADLTNGTFTPQTDLAISVSIQ